MAQQSLINPEILQWARNRAGLDIAVLAKKLSIREDKLQRWEDGNDYPSFKQAQKFAEKTYIPFGYLFLREVPQEELPIPDLRTVGSAYLNVISLELRDTIRTCIARVQWYKEYLTEQGIIENSFVGRMKHQSDAQQIVQDIKHSLALPNKPERGNAADYFRQLTQAIENIGILVMSNGIVGNNTHRPLAVDEFRGFAIADSQAPLIFINGADGAQPKLFTLIHELAHIWIGASGVSDASLKAHVDSEKLCNQIAGEFLVPESEFFIQWKIHNSFLENISQLASHFKVSQWVIARRALTLNMIDKAVYVSFIQHLKDEHANRDTGGGNYWKVQRARLSVHFAQAVSSEALSGRLLLRDASRLLDSKPNQIKKIYNEVMA